MGAIDAVVGGAMGMIQGQIDKKNQQDMMDYQANINEKAAEKNQERNKDMWNYTSYGNQRINMEAAGLNAALMYGQGGGGGQSAAGAQAQGSGLAESRTGKLTMDGIMMGLQAKQIESQTEVNKSQAEKNRVEAEKVSGVDTQEKEASIENIIAQTENEKTKNGLIYAQTRMQEAMEGLTTAKEGAVQWDIKNIEKSIELMQKNLEGTDLDNTLKSKTMDAEIKRATVTLENTLTDTLVKRSQGTVNQAQARSLSTSIAQKWSEIGIKNQMQKQGWTGLEQQAEKIANELTIGQGQIDVHDRAIIKDYVIGIGNLIMKGAGMAMTKGQ